MRSVSVATLVVAFLFAGESAARAPSLWSPVVDLYLPLQPPGAVIGQAGRPDADTDGLGNAVAVWSDWLNGTNAAVRAARFVGATQIWSVSVPLSTPAGSAAVARLAVATEGRTMRRVAGSGRRAVWSW